MKLTVAVLAVIGTVMVTWNQYLNGPLGGNPDLWHYIDLYVIALLLVSAGALLHDSE